jgi:hypothetical protein
MQYGRVPRSCFSSLFSDCRAKTFPLSSSLCTVKSFSFFSLSLNFLSLSLSHFFSLSLKFSNPYIFSFNFFSSPMLDRKWVVRWSVGKRERERENYHPSSTSSNIRNRAQNLYIIAVISVFSVQLTHTCTQTFSF